VRPELVTIQETIDRRVSAILTDRGDWPCRKGCDDCCRHLAAIPEITDAEWRELQLAISSIPVQEKSELDRRIADLREAHRPYTCPLLDRSSGACLVYAHRPIACRTYGFYLDRGEGLYCGRIQSRVDHGEYHDVVWGNQATIDDQSSLLGTKRTLIEWFELSATEISTQHSGDD
jgi:uncharacterized protein